MEIVNLFTVECSDEMEHEGFRRDPSFPSPTESGYDQRRHSWVVLPDSIVRDDPGFWAVGPPRHDVQ